METSGLFGPLKSYLGGGGGVIGGGGVLPYEKMTWMLVVSLGSIYLQGVRQTFT